MLQSHDVASKLSALPVCLFFLKLTWRDAGGAVGVGHLASRACLAHCQGCVAARTDRATRAGHTRVVPKLSTSGAGACGLGPSTAAAGGRSRDAGLHRCCGLAG